jgi:hypothetical protein
MLQRVVWWELTDVSEMFSTRLHSRSRGSLVSIVSTDWRTGRSGFVPSQRQRIFLLAFVSRPALRPTQSPVQWVMGDPSPGVKRGWGVTLTTHSHLLPRSWMSRSYISSPPSASMACSGTALLLFALLYQTTRRNIPETSLYLPSREYETSPSSFLYILFVVLNLEFRFRPCTPFVLNKSSRNFNVICFCHSLPVPGSLYVYYVVKLRKQFILHSVFSEQYGLICERYFVNIFLVHNVFLVKKNVFTHKVSIKIVEQLPIFFRTCER